MDFYPGWVTRDVVTRPMAAVPVERRVAFVVNDVQWLLDLVGYGRGVAVVPEVFSHKKTAAWFVPIAAPPTWQIAVATAAGRHPGAAAKALRLPRRRQTEPLRRREESAQRIAGSKGDCPGLRVVHL